MIIYCHWYPFMHTRTGSLCNGLMTGPGEEMSWATGSLLYKAIIMHVHSVCDLCSHYNWLLFSRCDNESILYFYELHCLLVLDSLPYGGESLLSVLHPILKKNAKNLMHNEHLSLMIYTRFQPVTGFYSKFIHKIIFEALFWN